MSQNVPYVKEETPGKKAWCSCSASKNQPYCDGSHAAQGQGKRPIVVEIESAKKVAWCGCRKSKNAPYCDGSHSRS